jgi:hypothetical protein
VRAIALARTLCEAGKDDASSQIRLGACLVICGRPGEAIPALERAAGQKMTSDWQVAQCHYFLGEALRSTGKPADADRAYERAVAASAKSRWGRRAEARRSAPKAPYR